MGEGRFSAGILAAAAALAPGSAAMAASWTINGFSWDDTNAVRSVTVVEGPAEQAYVINTPSGLPVESTVGRLAESHPGDPRGFALPLPDTGFYSPPEPNANRATYELSWGGLFVTNGPGADFAVYESGSGAAGSDEIFAVAVHPAGAAVFTAYRYRFYDAAETDNGGNFNGNYVTGFDLSGFGLSPRQGIDAIRIRNLFTDANTAGEAGDTVSGNGEGFVIFNAPSGNPFTLKGGTGYPAAGRLDADIAWVVSLWPLTARQPQGPMPRAGLLILR